MVQQKWQQATYANKDQSVAACHESLMSLLQLPIVGRQIKTLQQQAMSQSASANALVWVFVVPVGVSEEMPESTQMRIHIQT